MESVESAELRIGDKTLELPIVEGSEGEKAIDIKRLRSETGYITLDPGYANTGSCRSEISFIDGENGILRYRGYPIEELAEKSTFLEVAYLLIYGHLPTQTELDSFVGSITILPLRSPRLATTVSTVFQGTASTTASASAAASAGVVALAAFPVRSTSDVTDSRFGSRRSRSL